MNKIELILFDLGGVLYRVDHNRTISTFRNLSAKPELFDITDKDDFSKNEMLISFEKGEISRSVFRESLRIKYGLNASDEMIDDAWNQTLIGLYPNAEDLVSKLAKKYRLALLSNTNEIHCEKFSSQCKELLSHFEEIFYSFQLHFRKPEINIYKIAISRLGLDPQKILFVDDLLENIESADKLLLGTYHINSNNTLSDLVNLYLS